MTATLRALRLALTALILALVAQAAGALELSLSPSRVMLDFTAGRAQGKVEVTNHSADDTTIEVSAGDFRLDAEGRVVDAPPGPQGLSRWLVVSPARLEVPAGRTRTIRFAVRPRGKPKTGEYAAMIWVEDSAAAARARAGGATFTVRFGAPVYATYGPVSRAGRLHGVRRGGPGLVFDIGAEGDAHVRLRGRWAVWPRGAYPGDAAVKAALGADKPEDALRAAGARAVGPLPAAPVFPGERRRIALPVQGLPGSGVIHVHGRLGDADLSRSFRF